DLAAAENRDARARHGRSLRAEPSPSNTLLLGFWHRRVTLSRAHSAYARLRAADLAPAASRPRPPRRSTAPDRGGEPAPRRRGRAARPPPSQLRARSRACPPAPPLASAADHLAGTSRGGVQDTSAERAPRPRQRHRPPGAPALNCARAGARAEPK